MKTRALGALLYLAMLAISFGIAVLVNRHPI